MVHFYQIQSKKRKKFLGGMGVNSTIILINAVCFILVWTLLSMGVLSENFFNNNIAISLENVQNLRLWTFVTSMFMHGGFFHLFVNMLTLFFIGSLVERILGKKRYLWFYLSAGFFASLLYTFFEFLIPSGLGAVGASGALFGLIGLLMLLTPDLPVYIMFIPIPIKIKYAAPGILVLLWIISAVGDVPIGNTAHLGGLVLGLAYGIYLRKKYKHKSQYIRKQFS